MNKSVMDASAINVTSIEMSRQNIKNKIRTTAEYLLQEKKNQKCAATF